MRSLIDIVAMPSAASSDIDYWGQAVSAAGAASGGEALPADARANIDSGFYRGLA